MERLTLFNTNTIQFHHTIYHDNKIMSEKHTHTHTVIYLTVMLLFSLHSNNFAFDIVLIFIENHVYTSDFFFFF